MKLVIQIPCYNEAQTLPLVLGDIPKAIEGISVIEVLVIDDGSYDGSSEVAREHGAVVVRNLRNLGLAHSFRRGLNESLARGADIIVNIDGDRQYKAQDIPRLIRPILENKADMVIADRQVHKIPHFSSTKKLLQKAGSAVVRRLSRVHVVDTVSGFRAFSRKTAIRLTILSPYTYTLESILQAQSKGLTIVNIPVETNPATRKSRLMRNMRSYLAFSTATIIRIFTMYNPLKVFLALGGTFLVAGGLIVMRFLYFYVTVGGQGKLQSLLLGAVLLIVGAMIALVGMLADLIQFNRRLLEDILERVKELELRER